MNSYNFAVNHFFDPHDFEDADLDVNVKRLLEERSEHLEVTTTEEGRLMRLLVQQESALEKFEHEIASNQNKGEAIYNNYQRIEQIF